MLYEISFGYLLLISIWSVIVCVFDKHRARVGGRRVREKTLLLLSALGGGAAMYCTMRIIRHKTRHNKFMIGIPLIIVVQITIIILIYLGFS
ncbi:MAG: DUF1294 domain-containing protein [Clostridia bacterium]|nr:DUF1294 domain-containing protein [Clostridia bacterium]